MPTWRSDCTAISTTGACALKADPQAYLALLYDNAWSELCNRGFRCELQESLPALQSLGERSCPKSAALSSTKFKNNYELRFVVDGVRSPAMARVVQQVSTVRE